MGKNIVITGGTGLVGKALTKLLLLQDYHVTILTRSPNKANASNTFGNQVTYAAWDVDKQTIDVKALQNTDYIIHLAGAGVVDKPWTKTYKKQIVDSRVESAKLLFNTLKKNPNKVKAIISSSAIGWYGADNNSSREIGFTEEAQPAKDFLGETCKLWEDCIQPFETLGIRHACIRTGIVLSKKGGALAEFKKPIYAGIAGILGSGKQMVSWIHIDDLCQIFYYALENENIKGSFNAVAPKPVNNSTLTTELAKAMRGKWFITMSVPAFVLKIMMGERSEEVLKSCTVSAKKIGVFGFKFKYPLIKEAVDNLVR